MTKTKTAPGVNWHKERKPKPKSRIDLKFEEWAKRNGINLKEIPVMEKK